MNWYDWVLIAPIVLGVILGFRVGLVKNVLYIVLVAVTMVVGGYLSQIIVDAIGLELESDGLVTVIGYGLLLIGGFLSVQLFSGVVQAIVSKLTFGIGDRVNQVGGLVSGLILGFLITTVIVIITARWTYTPDEDEEGRLEISEEAIAKMFENSLKDTSREAADLVIRESLMVGVVIDVKDLLGGEFIGNVEGPKILQLSISLSVGVMVALELNVKSYLESLGELEKTDHRQTILQGSMGQTIIDNSFNSNPISFISSLETLEDFETEGKKYLITPGMVELGSEQFSYNFEFAHFASEIIDEALIVGFTNKGPLMLAFEENNIPVKYFKNRDLAVSYLNSVVNENDVVLFENDLPDHHP